MKILLNLIFMAVLLFTAMNTWSAPSLTKSANVIRVTDFQYWKEFEVEFTIELDNPDNCDLVFNLNDNLNDILTNSADQAIFDVYPYTFTPNHGNVSISSNIINWHGTIPPSSTGILTFTVILEDVFGESFNQNIVEGTVFSNCNNLQNCGTPDCDTIISEPNATNYECCCEDYFLNPNQPTGNPNYQTAQDLFSTFCLGNGSSTGSISASAGFDNNGNNTDEGDPGVYGCEYRDFLSGTYECGSSYSSSCEYIYQARPSGVVVDKQCGSTIVTIPDSSCGDIEINWGDGNSTNDTFPYASHTYNTEGNYTISYSCIESHGVYTNSGIYITELYTAETYVFCIEVLPCCEIEAEITSIDLPECGSGDGLINFTGGNTAQIGIFNSTTGNTDILTSSTSPNSVSYLFPNAGAYDITLTTETGPDCSETTTMSVDIPECPILCTEDIGIELVDIDLQAFASICVEEVFNISLSGNVLGSLTIDGVSQPIGDARNGFGPISQSFSSSGNYLIEYKTWQLDASGNKVCEESISKTVIVEDCCQLSPVITTSYDPNSCGGGQTIDLSYEGGISGTIEILLNGSPVLNVPVTSPGVYSYNIPSVSSTSILEIIYSAVGNNPNCMADTQIAYDIMSCPCEKFEVTSNLSTPPICAGSNGIISYSGGNSGQLSITPPNGTGTIYNNLPSSGTQSHLFSQPGTYSIQYIGLVNDPDCNQSITYNVNVEECPPILCCEGIEIVMSREGNDDYLEFNGLSVLGDQVNLQVNGLTAPIKEVRLSMADFEVNYEDDLCTDCNDFPISWGSLAVFSRGWQFPPITDPSQPGNLSADFAYKESTLDVSGNSTTSWQNLNLYLGLPTLNEIGCCSLTINFCIKVTVIDENCIACEEYFCGEIIYDEQGQGTMNFLGIQSNF